MPSNGSPNYTEGVPGNNIDLIPGSGIYIIADPTAGTIEIGNTTEPPAISDHGALTGLDDDDHPQYLLYTGATADVLMGNHQVISTVAGTITRNNNLISSITLGSGRTLTITRDANNLISSYTDGTRTWSIIRDTDNHIMGWTVT